MKPKKLIDQERQKLVKLLTSHLEEHSDLQTKKWFNNYLKGAIEYRGLKTPHVTLIVKNWYESNQLGQYAPMEQFVLCRQLIASKFAEDKFAGTIYIQKFLLTKINYQELLVECNLLFQQNCFFDWSTTDWFCTRILDPTIVKHGIAAAQIIANWRYADNFWQRRAAIVSFRGASSNQEYHSLIASIIDDLVKENQRFIQTGIGWVLADMSKIYPTEVEAIFRKYLRYFNREVIDRHSKYLPCHQELKQLIRLNQS